MNDVVPDPKFSLKQREADGKYAMFTIVFHERITCWHILKRQAIKEFNEKYPIDDFIDNTPPEEP